VFVLAAMLLAIPVHAQEDETAGTSTQRESKVIATFPGSPLDQPAPGEAGKQKSWADYLGLSEKQQQDMWLGIEKKIRSLDTLSSQGMDNPIVRARFEKFLNAAPADPKDVERYLTIARKASELLRVHDAQGACKLLYEMSAFEWDAEIGQSLAARVEVAWDMRLTQAQLDAKVATLRKEIEAKVWNTEMMMNQETLIGSAKDKQQSSGQRSQQSSGNNSNQPVVEPGTFGIDALLSGGLSAPGRKLRATEEYLRRLEAGARLKTSELKSDAIELKNRSDFQDYVTSLFTTRRHLHTVIGADFYRTLFGGGDYPPLMANQVNGSREIYRDVEQAVDVIKFKMENNELAGAYEHLQYAFAASEFHPALLTLSRESKRKIRAFGFNVVKLQNMLEARDFGDVDPLLKEMQAQAADFDATKVRSIVDAVKLESRLRLGAAKLAAQAQDLKTAMNEFRAAAQSWPGNPDLDLAQLGFFNSQDVKTKLQVEFDRLISAKDYRAIFDKQLQLATALVGDNARIEQMKDALEKVKGVETAIEKANIFRRNNSMFAAWEALEMAARDWSDDSLLNKMRAELSGESAEFVHQIKKGEDAERAGQLGFSLACYLNAQRLYPASELARTAVDRLSAKLLNKSS